jgi:hypothetical protein
MKKAYVLVIMLLPGFILEAQQYQWPSIETSADRIPDWLNDMPENDEIWGIGAGKLSSEKASCELAKFNAQASICRSLSYSFRYAETKLDNPSPSEQDLTEKLNWYQNEFYTLRSLMASEQAAFELSEFIKVERLTKTADGTIWCLASIQNDIASKFNLEKAIRDYTNDFIESYPEISNDDFSENLNMPDEALKN